MVTLVLTLAYFAAVYLGRRPKLCLLVQHGPRSTKRIYGVAAFGLWPLADSIKRILFSSYKRPSTTSDPARTQILDLP